MSRLEKEGKMMMQLVAPSEALSGSFVLPRADIDDKPAPSSNTQTDFMGYAIAIGQFGLLLPTDTPSTMIEEQLPFCRLPNTPPWLRGMANYYGNIVPIFDFERLLELPVARLDSPRILLIGAGEKALAITVAEPPLRIRLTANDTLAGSLPLPTRIQPFVQACYKTDQVWIKVDIRELFLALGESH